MSLTVNWQVTEEQVDEAARRVAARLRRLTDQLAEREASHEPVRCPRCGDYLGVTTRRCRNCTQHRR